MRLNEHLSASGEVLFRWRGVVLLVFAPFLYMATLNGEQVEHALGEPLGDAFEMASLGLVVLGQLIRILTVGFVPANTSGRNTAGQLADALNTTGAYSLVRNPLYLGNCVMYLGVALFSQSVLVALVLALVLLPYYERIIAAEEKFLSAKFGTAYEDWAARTPAFVPRFSGWVPLEVPFSWRTVLAREQASVFFAIVALYLLETGLHHAVGEPEPMEVGWHWLLAATVALKLIGSLHKRRRKFLAAKSR